MVEIALLDMSSNLDLEWIDCFRDVKEVLEDTNEIVEDFVRRYLGMTLWE